jgi:hypothetical protein
LAKNQAIPMQQYYPDCDARTLAEAKKIQNNPKRLLAAAKAAKSMVEDAKKDASALKSIARKAK